MDELDRLIWFIQSTSIPNSNQWIQSLRDGSTDAVIALLLSCLPSLKALYLIYFKNRGLQRAVVGGNRHLK
ncbi:uncharacterized protein ANIA_11387 [Aspergillus nidulans FGSC A4]|uniref:Uncharacterized protein n=1 Tax=Emericella nidulans (strain FGSC A4 / ATCC 38163 / CBS 112.46 / NRRL 194 / M139) TaxID=227321 RepID=C8VHW7_EMENI|nr:hypothetical protein [Aspergillus nidulans FGSC A4]CBF82940.1 TPA: hypothetical protein ANIA_11387 [Aspergillus nidulans FGSC A4]